MIDFAGLRSHEFGRLEEAGHTYVDYTGSGLHPQSLVREHAGWLEDSILGNPHSLSPSSKAATQVCQQARLRVLDFFGANPDTHEVIFTANASAALKLVGESFPFQRKSRFVLSADNHNSVNGLTAFAERRGARVRYLPLDDNLRLSSFGLASEAAPSLFALPAQSNFSGVKHDLGLVGRAHEAGYRVLLDAAGLVPTSRLDLERVAADFTAVSFYKMFGYPTGIGALIARRVALAELRRPWFSGGTVEFASVQNRMHSYLPGHEAFEDGTVNFQGLGAVPLGLDFLDRVGMERVEEHVRGITAYALERLSNQRHACGALKVRLYGPRDLTQRGGTIAFNLLDDSGRAIPYGQVEAAAGRSGISLRGGCFCNPGSAEAAFGFPAELAARCLGSMDPGEFTVERFAGCLGDHPVGALRVSFGVASALCDVDRVVELLSNTRFEKAAHAPDPRSNAYA